MDMLHALLDGFRMMRHARHVKTYGYPRHEGDVKDICKAVVENCWNGAYFQTSAGHFNHFWMRDFAFCADALKRCGHKTRALQTMEWALEHFARHDRVTTHITRFGMPVDFPCMAVDSLALLARSLHILKAKGLVREYQDFLERKADEFARRIIDPAVNMVRKGHFSSIKDHAVRLSSTYDNSMAAMLKGDLDALQIKNPLRAFDIMARIRDELWNGRYFAEDMTKRFTVTGDANTFPFWCGVFTDKKMARSAIASIVREGLDRPFPLKYTKTIPQNLIPFYDWISGGYERNNVWVHLGLCYMDVVRSVDKKLFKTYLDTYGTLIEKRGNLLEVFTPEGAPFQSMSYAADHDMIWAAKMLDFLSSP